MDSDNIIEFRLEVKSYGNPDNVVPRLLKTLTRKLSLVLGSEFKLEVVEVTSIPAIKPDDELKAGDLVRTITQTLIMRGNRAVTAEGDIGRIAEVGKLTYDGQPMFLVVTPNYQLWFKAEHLRKII